VPFPFAVDDHQTTNAKVLSDQDAAILLPQNQLTKEAVVNLLLKKEQTSQYRRAAKAYFLRKTDATEQVVRACELLSGKTT
jgi:UDP-N-acetylglucosamine--N-acetylmuramyl-(pentapeptide) pyrophosphoryl-undecaprenol N-acetylglucosamine transferase